MKYRSTFYFATQQVFFSTRSLAVSLLSMMVLAVSPVYAQDGSLQLGIGFLAGIPQGEFRDHVDNAGFGLDLSLGYNPSGSPMVFGLEGGIMNYGSETRQEPLSSTIPDVTVQVDNSNNIVLAQFFLRLQPQTGSFRPYAEGSLGFNYLFTETTVSNEFEGDNVFSSTNQDDIAFSYGLGGGMMFLLGSFNEDDDLESGTMDLLLDMRGKYMWGGEADYLKEGSIRREAGQVQYDTERSKTDMLLLQVGVSLRFSP